MSSTPPLSTSSRTGHLAPNTFITRFVPGLILGLLVGGLAGAFLAPIAEQGIGSGAKHRAGSPTPAPSTDDRRDPRDTERTEPLPTTKEAPTPGTPGPATPAPTPPPPAQPK